MKKYRFIALLVIIQLLLAACATTGNFDEWINGWVGADSDRLLKGGWGRLIQETVLSNGNTEYVFNIGSAKGENLLPDTCIVYFEADKQTKKIIRIHYEGNRCKRAPSFV